MEKKIVSILIPAYNEEKRIGKTLEPLLKSQFIHEIIVIDDGSQDQTAKKAMEKGVIVSRLEKNMGKGPLYLVILIGYDKQLIFF